MQKNKKKNPSRAILHPKPRLRQCGWLRPLSPPPAGASCLAAEGQRHAGTEKDNCGSLGTIRKMFGNGLNPGRRPALGLFILLHFFSPPPTPPVRPFLFASRISAAQRLRRGVQKVHASEMATLCSPLLHFLLVASVLLSFLERPYYRRLSEDLPAVRGRPYPRPS